MASVSSLDHDMRKLRLDRFTPEAAAEVKTWIETTLGEKLPSAELLEGLKDGVALCKLVNLVLPAPGVKYKASSMPFTQRENISQFLKACELPPLNLPAHDRFLTVDLYDEKDPAQVVQCLGAFSRAANAVNSSKFPNPIGPKRSGATSPTRRPASSVLQESRSGSNARNAFGSPDSDSKNTSTRALTPTLTGGSDSSKAADGISRGASTVSSWSKKSDEATTAPAWNIHQYGYMGGASQGNQGISFGARRQITSAGVGVPSLADKERRRKEQEEEARAQAEEAERKRRAEREAEERQARIAEEQRWEEETRKAREREKDMVERQRREWAEEERRWEEEQSRRKQEEEAQSATRDSPALRGQFLSEYNEEQKSGQRSVSDNERIKQLERQLEEAKERERRYQLEREEKDRRAKTPENQTNEQTYRRPQSISQSSADDSMVSASDEREFLRKQWEEQPKSPSPSSPPARSPFQRPLPTPKPAVSSPNPINRPSKPLDPPQAERQPVPPPSATAEPPQALSSRTETATSGSTANGTERFLADSPAPSTIQPKSHYPSEMGMSSTSERAAEDARRAAGQTKTKAGGWASKSLLEKEMEMERQRQKEWEEQQMAKVQASAAQRGLMGPRELKR